MGASPQQKSVPELLAPAGGPEQLLEAIHFGADAVYLAGPRWGMRARARNFSLEELAHAVQTAHAAGVKVHVTPNAVMRDADMAELPAYLEALEEAGVDALIVADLGAMQLARTYAPTIELHISTQANVTSAETAKAFQSLGAKRIVLAREMTIEEIAHMRDELPPELELEAFVHGSLCLAYAGRCLLSSALMGPERAASRGACAQPCRWGWALADERDPSRRLPLIEEGKESFILSSNDICMIEHLDDLIAAGGDSLKIEGRNKGAYYVACVTNAYRQVLDGGEAGLWREELEHVSHRPYSCGYYYGHPEENQGEPEYARDRALIGIVADVKTEDGTCWAEFSLRNRADAGCALAVLSPHEPVRTFVPEHLEAWDEESASWKDVPSLAKTMGRCRMEAPFAVSSGDVLAREL